MTNSKSFLQRGPIWGAGILWAIAAAAGVGWLIKFQMTPGPAAAAAVQWPAAATWTPAPDRPTLLMFLHPACPCSRASLEELQRLMIACSNHVAVRVLFFKPATEPDSWIQTDLWKLARDIADTNVQADPDGALAQAFGARTSGHVIIYSPQGRPLFSGGITDGRGHSGDNPGLAAATKVLRGNGPADSTIVVSEVFGCAISWPATAPAEARP